MRNSLLGESQTVREGGCHTCRRAILSAAALLFLGLYVSPSGPAEAVPIKNPENCQGPVTIGVATCPDKPGHWVECIPSGDYMCCTSNEQGGKDCEQIESLKGGVKGNMGRIPGGKLQVAPTNPAPKTSPFQEGGMNKPILRRGVESESPTGQGENPTVPK